MYIFHFETIWFILVTLDKNKHFSSLKLWKDDSSCCYAESKIFSLTDQNKKLTAQLEEEEEKKRKKKTQKTKHNAD